MSEFEFLDELPGGNSRKGRRGSEVLRGFAAALRANPGKWAKYRYELSAGGARGLNGNIRRGASAAFRDGNYESRTVAGVAYVRYRGGAA